MTDIDKTIEEAKAAVLPFESWERLTGESSAHLIPPFVSVALFEPKQARTKGSAGY
jgi:hypothetical protein